MTRMLFAAGSLVVVMLAGCATPPAPASEGPESPTSPPSAAFAADEVAEKVVAVMEAECLGAEERLCGDVQFNDITLENGVLGVPTMLDADAGENAQRLCELFAPANIDPGTGALLGITSIEILSAGGDAIATCPPQS